MVEAGGIGLAAENPRVAGGAASEWQGHNIVFPPSDTPPRPHSPYPSLGGSFMNLCMAFG